MTLPTALQDREYQKFEVGPDDETRVKTSSYTFIDATGALVYPQLDADGSLPSSMVPSGLKIAGRITEVVINATTWTALPATPLASRKSMAIQNFSGQLIKLNYVPTTPGLTGVYVMDQNERFYDISDTILIYAKSTSGTCTIVTEEIS